MAITAETRNSIIELVVTAYNAPPGTTLLTELVAIVDGGGTLADVATALTTSDTWSGLYPSFQTAEEFATEWLGNLVPEASADALAGGIEIAVGLINGGASFADVILVAQDFLANLAEDDAEFGSSAANFNNKVEVATYHTVTLEQDADDIGDLQNVLANVTSDDDSVADAEEDAAAAVPGETVSLTTGLDTGAAFTTGSTNDVFSAVDAGDAEIDTLTTGDSLDGGDGTDTLSLAISGGVAASASSVSTTNVENVKIYNNSSSAYSLDASLMVGVTDVFVNAGTSATSVETDGIVNLHLMNTTQNATIDSGDVDGSADEAIILASGANDGAAVTSLTATYNGLETVNLVSTGSANEVTLSVDSLETLNVSGETDIAVVASFDGVDTDADTATFDASAAGGDVSAYLTAEGGVTSVTMGAGDDTINFRSTINAEVTIAGGEGTDTLQLGYLSNVAVPTAGEDITFDAEAEAAEAAGLNVSGIEALQLWSTDVDGRALSGNAESSITSLTAFGSSAVTYMPISSITHISSGTVTLGDAEAEVAGAGGDVTALTLTQADILSTGTLATTLVADEIESLTILNAGEAAYTVTMSEDGSASLTSAIIAGSGKQTVDIGGDALATVNAAGVTGSETFTLTADGGADVTVTASSVRPDDTDAETANVITTGEGADSITGGAYIDDINVAGGDNYVMAGSGDDTVVASEGADTIMGGAGDDNITAGEGMNIITGEAGDDVITSGDDDDDLSGGAGDDNITSTKGDDTIDGGAGDDTLSGGRGDDLITGGEGDDVIFAGTGADTVNAGGDDDLISITDIDSEDVVDGGAGVDSMVGNAAGIDAEANYQANAIFVDTSGESAELNLPGIEALWLDWNNTDAEGSDLDMSGAESLVTLYLDINSAEDVASEESMTISGLTATTINLRDIADAGSEGTVDIRGDEQDVTINTVGGFEGDMTFNIQDFGAVTLNLNAVVNAEGEATEGEVDFAEGVTFGRGTTDVTINSVGGTNGDGENSYELGGETYAGGVTIDSEDLTSITITSADVYFGVEGISVENSGEIDDGLSITATVADGSALDLDDIIAAEADEVSVTITAGDDAEVYVDALDLGESASVSITAGVNSYVEVDSAEFDGSLSITSGFATDVDIPNTLGSGESFSLTLSGRGDINGEGDAEHSLNFAADSTTLNLSGWNDAEGTQTVTVNGESTATSVTIIAGGETDVDVTSTEMGTGEADDEYSFTYTGEGEVTVTTGESDDTIVTGAGTDTIITGGGNDVVSAGAGSDSITVAGGDAEDFDTISSLDVDAAEASNDDQDTIVLDSSEGTGELSVLTDEAEGVDVAGAADAEDGVDAGDVLATVADGIMTLAADTEGEGTAEDLAAFDELAEYVNAALLVMGEQTESGGAEANVDELAVAFVFDGDTYVVTGTSPEDTAEVTLDDVVKLTGLSGEETLVTAGAADAILIG